MKRGILYVVAAVIVVFGVSAAVTPLRQRARQLAADLRLIRADTGDVMASATYQRFATRREAVAAMRAALLGLAAAESTFVADSGRPTTGLFSGRYAFANDKSNLGPSIEIQRDGWVAKTGNIHTSMSCTLTAMLDTTTWRYHAGEPVCREWTAAESTALAQAPVAIHPVSEPPKPAQPAGAPRKHRDWGPVNNTAPPTPWIAHGACPEEYCHYGFWRACGTVMAFKSKSQNAPRAFTMRRGEVFAALTGDVHVQVPGVVVFRHPIVNPPGGMGVDSIRFTAADTLYLLNPLGEGYAMWWFRGRADTGYQFWTERPEIVPFDTAVQIRPTESTWWVQVRNAANLEGWIKYAFDEVGGPYQNKSKACKL
jgi:hypothetical protein